MKILCCKIYRKDYIKITLYVGNCERKLKYKHQEMNSYRKTLGFVAFYYDTQVLTAFALNLRTDRFSYILIFIFCVFVDITHTDELSK